MVVPSARMMWLESGEISRRLPIGRDVYRFDAAGRRDARREDSRSRASENWAFLMAGRLRGQIPRMEEWGWGGSLGGVLGDADFPEAIVCPLRRSEMEHEHKQVHQSATDLENVDREGIKELVGDRHGEDALLCLVSKALSSILSPTRLDAVHTVSPLQRRPEAVDASGEFLLLHVAHLLACLDEMDRLDGQVAESRKRLCR
jgi:hypothetical protein